jgi:WD40 repeat protein
VRLWEVGTGRPRDPFLVGHNDLVSSVAFSPDGRILASGSDDSTILLWDLDKGQPRGQYLARHEGGITDLAFSPDGSTLASSSQDGTIRLWDIATNSFLGPPLAFHTSDVLGVVFSPDGQTLRLVSEDGTYHLWQAGLDAWRERACRMANRNLTCSEWRQYFRDDRGESYHATCPDLPLPECPNADSGYQP